MKHIQNEGVFVRWHLPVVDETMGYDWLPKEIANFKGKPFYKVILGFIDRYTGLDKRKFGCFTDTFDISEMFKPLKMAYSTWSSAYCSESGLRISCRGPWTMNEKQRHDFYFLILKCKYKADQCERIIDYYSKHPLVGIEGGLLNDFCHMTLSDDGVEPYEYDFIKDVKLEPKQCLNPLRVMGDACKNKQEI